MSIRRVHKFFADNGIEVSLRTLQHWCQTGQCVARKKLPFQVKPRKDGRNEWLIDVHSLKTGGTLSRELYEEMMVGAVNREGL